MDASLDTVEALIMVASRPEGVRDAIEHLRPKAVGLIVSQQILEHVVPVCTELRENAEFLYTLVDSPMEIRDAFERFEYLLSCLEEIGYSREEIFLDPTGGTTPMRVGTTLAAMTRGVKMLHQRADQEYVDGRWRVKEGAKTEIVPMENPLEATGLLRESQAVELFNRRDYGAAALVFEDIVRKLSGVERIHYYQGLLFLAEGYGAWDVVDYGKALEKLRAAREKLSVRLAEQTLAERAGPLVDRISINLPFLGRMRSRLSMENVVDMLENARRRIADQGRYDDGVARLYRTVEMWHHHRLRENCGISAEKVEWKKVSPDVRERFLQNTQADELPKVLGLKDARTLDRILSGEIEEDEAVLRDLLQKRNHSILAHGLMPIGGNTALRFLEYVDSVVKAPESRIGAEHVRLRKH